MSFYPENKQKRTKKAEKWQKDAFLAEILQILWEK
jgi:hypothetical protein